MPWVEKHTRTPLETLPIYGLHFRVGDLVARQFQQSEWDELGEGFKAEKRAEIQFPSGLTFDVEASAEEANALVHLFSHMDVPYFATRDQAWAIINPIAAERGYLAAKQRNNRLLVAGYRKGEHFLLTFDNAARRLVNVVNKPAALKEAQRQRRNALVELIKETGVPPLGANDALGLEALARIKFFLPDADWIDYVCEFDGRDVLYGLGVGWSILVGYGYLSELAEMRNIFGIPMQCDFSFQPKTLRELKEMHEQERREGNVR